jgi:hypothetical protein
MLLLDVPARGAAANRSTAPVGMASRRVQASDRFQTRSELIDNVAHDAVIRRGGGCEHREIGRQTSHDADNPAIVRPEVMAPIRDAVCPIHHKQCDARGNRRKETGDEGLIGQALGRDQQDVDSVRKQLGPNPVPIVGIRRVDCLGTNSDPARGFDLIAHQRQ